MTSSLEDNGGASATAAPTRKTGGYVILKEIETIGQIEEALSAEGKLAVYVVYKERVDARDSGAAVKNAAEGDNAVDEGVYVAVPTGSFKPRRVKQVVQVTLD